MNTQPEAPKPPCPADNPLYRSLAPRLRAGMLSPRELEALRRHLRFCAACRDEALAAVSQVIEEGVRREYGVPTHVPPFLTLDDIQQRVSLTPAVTPPDTAGARGASDSDQVDRLPVSLNHRGKQGKRMMYDDHAPPSSPAESWPRQSIQPNKKPNRWRAIAAVASAIAIIALFALLLRGFADGKGSPSPLGADGTATADATTTAQATPSDTHGKWQVMDSMTYSTTVFTQTPYPVFSPKDPAIVYETSMSPVSLRRSDDGGVTWQPLDLPPGSDQAIVIEIFASPLDAHSAFLTVTVNMAYGQGLNACPSSARASVGGATHGNILASGQAPCSTTYRTTDEGQSWKKISFPVNGTISTPYSEAAPFAGTLLQAQGTRLYALLGCGPTCGGSSGRLVRSSDGGATWRVADGGVGQGVCDFATLPASQTIFATVSNGSCDAINSPAVSLYRSNNGGAGWLTVGALPKGASSQGMAAVMVGGKPVLVMNLPQVSWQPHIINVSQSADEFAVSNDGGHTWKTSPLAGAPTKALPIVAPLIVRADGSLVVSFTTSEDQGQAAKLYTWRPGETSWRIFAPAPDGHLSTLRYTVSPNGDETFWAVVKSATTLSGNDTYSVARYQP